MKHVSRGWFAARAAVLALATVGPVVLISSPARAEAKKTAFSGTATRIAYDWGTWLSDGESVFVVGGSVEFADAVTDPRVAGVETDTMAGVADATTMEGVMWGRMCLTNDGGWWEGYYQLTTTPFVDSAGPHLRTEVRTVCSGGGGYNGLVGRWNYTAVDGLETGVYDIDGYIVEARGGPGDRPFQLKAVRTDRLEIHPCIVILPPSDPPQFGLIGKEEIVSEVGEALHLGRYTNQGLGLMDPTTGTASGMGTVRAANGDLLYWVTLGNGDPTTGVFNYSVHFAGGTGRFEDAVGGFEGVLHETITPVDPPFVFELTFPYRPTGTIRY